MQPQDPAQSEYEQKMRSLRRLGADALLTSDFPVSGPGEEKARLVRNDKELLEIYRVCSEAGYYGESSLLDFIKERIK
ncbi:hypothetical protein F2S72_08910 [Pseudomonas syringae pv. actinidiae]|nr:hypothetical protein [Pseudomonas syringae pv. actinidiae]